jgi:hypothetical protein
LNPQKQNFYLWMDFNCFYKIIKVKGSFLLEIYISTKLDQK